MDNTITSKGIAQLARLNQLQLRHFDNKLAWRKVDARIRTHWDFVMQERHRAREVSILWIDKSIRRNETLTPSGTVGNHRSLIKDRVRLYRGSWLDDLETGISRDEQVTDIALPGVRTRLTLT